MNLLGTQQAADKLGVSVRRVLALIYEGKLAAQQIGREYVIQESALTDVTTYGKAGRPKKQDEGETAVQATATNGAVPGVPNETEEARPVKPKRAGATKTKAGARVRASAPAVKAQAGKKAQTKAAQKRGKKQ